MTKIHIYENGRFIGSQQTKVKAAPTGESFPFLIQYQGQWRPGIIDSWGSAAIDLSHTAAAPQPIPQVAKVVKAPQAAPQRPQVSEVTYEAWRAGKLGKGEKVTAPRGMGEEWAARLYCEKAITLAKRHRNSNNSRKQYRAGSYSDRRRSMAKQDKRHAWDKGIEPAEAIYAADGPCVTWVAKKELINYCLDYSRSLLQVYF